MGLNYVKTIQINVDIRKLIMAEGCFENYGASEFLETVQNISILKQIQESTYHIVNSWFTHEPKQINWLELLQQFESISPITKALSISYLIREIFFTFIFKIYASSPILLTADDDMYDPFDMEDISNEVKILFSDHMKELLNGEIKNLTSSYFRDTFTTLDLGILDSALSNICLSVDDIKKFLEEKYPCLSSQELIDNFRYEYTKEEILKITVDNLDDFLCTLFDEYTKKYESKYQLSVLVEQFSKHTIEYKPFQYDIEFLEDFPTINSNNSSGKHVYPQFSFSSCIYESKPYYLPATSNFVNSTYTASMLSQIFFLSLYELGKTDLKFTKCPQCKKLFILQRYRSKYCSKSCGNKAKHENYIEKGFNKDYHRFRKRFYQLHASNHKTYDDMQQIFEKLYNSYKKELSELTTQTTDILEFNKKAEQCYHKYKKQYKDNNADIQ
ncbi:MAG: hypothetical protein NC489_24775 [Ruminococcus flavefaciens]|nr:hypothetical protein [Ruminococcus flavefaciens]